MLYFDAVHTLRWLDTGRCRDVFQVVKEREAVDPFGDSAGGSIAPTTKTKTNKDRFTASLSL